MGKKIADVNTPATITLAMNTLFGMQAFGRFDHGLYLLLSESVAFFPFVMEEECLTLGRYRDLKMIL
jgi:hypothetical protein